jgi:hypothetical protein
MKKKTRIQTGLLLLIGGILVPSLAHAHCPLCTAGAGILAVIAASLGVPALIVSTFLGGFAFAMGLWIAPLITKKYFTYQDAVLTWLIYLSTVIPLWPLLREYKTLYAPYIGFDKYAEKVPVDVYIVGAILGALLLLLAPIISKKVTALKGEQLIPFQGIVITFILLVSAPLLVNWLFLI